MFEAIPSTTLQLGLGLGLGRSDPFHHLADVRSEVTGLEICSPGLDANRRAPSIVETG